MCELDYLVLRVIVLVSFLLGTNIEHIGYMVKLLAQAVVIFLHTVYILG